MSIRLLRLLTFAVCLFGSGNLFAQNQQISLREKQWQSYALPSEEFSRESDAAKTVLFRAPTAWHQKAGELSFAGPHSSFIKVFIEKAPDGIPLSDYVAAVTQQLRNQPGAEAMIIRRTQMSGLEAREILLEIPDANGEMSHRAIWCAVDGPNAVSFLLVTPSPNVQEIEPSFKAVIQSVNILGEAQFGAFESLRAETIKESKPARIDEVQRLTNTLNSLDHAARNTSIDKLAAVFAVSPDSAVDLIMDRRAIVRAAAVEAIGLSRNPTLSEFLFRALEDREAFVAERAAKAVAMMPNVTGALRLHSLDWLQTETIARVWAFLSADRKREILREIFKEGARPGPTKAVANRTTAPPLPQAVPVLGRVIVRSPQPIPQRPSVGDPSAQLGALVLLRETPLSDFQLPLAALIATNNDTLIRTALEIALDRRERLPVEPLLKLLNSPNNELVKLAAENLGQSGSPTDITKIEAQLNKQPKSVASRSEPTLGPVKQITDATAELILAIQKIRLRKQIAAAARDDRIVIIKKALSDPKLADWVWLNFARDENEAGDKRVDVSQVAAGQPINRPPAISPLAENILPANVTLYAALPTPLESFDRLGRAFEAIQMDTARQQADLVLMMNALRRQLTTQLNAENDSSVFDYLGINGAAPAVFARWTADGAPRGIASAVRRAIVIRVTDPERFERVLGLYQRTAGDSEHLTDYISGGVRFLGLLPGAFPIAAKMLMEEKAETPRDMTILRLGFVGTTQWNGYPIKTIEQDKIDSTGHFSHDIAYFTHLGDAAVVTPDLDSMRDVLTRVAAGKPTLAANQDFKAAAQTGGDAIYFSNLSDLFAPPADRGEPNVIETGSLKITNSAWENLFQLKFPASDWSKPLVRFKPEELTAPRELLPSTTFAYFMMKVDAPKAWATWKTLLGPDEQQTFNSMWAADPDRDVIPELGPECGLAAVGVPNISGTNWDLPLVLFFRLKGDKLEHLFDNGALFKAKPANTHLTRFRFGTEDVLATIRNGFLVLANNESALAALDNKEKLASSSDFVKAVKRAPDDVVAFAGLNQDAGVSAIIDSVVDPEKRRQLSAMLSIAKAFHSQNFYATADTSGVGAHFSTLIGREGRYSVAELSSLSKDQGLTFAIIEARGVPISNQQQLTSIRLRIRAKGGEVDRLINDISSSTQLVTKKSDQELEVTIQPRRLSTAGKIELPIADPALAPYLQSTREIRANDPTVIAKAREIAGNDRNAWSVARKLGDWTFKNLTWKHVDFADAAQTLATREADCSEFSHLYVAMARSLGLPARTVSGLAHSGSAFGGHAWVEVYVGQWIELDPTFGTDFVDATHIRDSTGGFLTYAALNLIDIEVLEAPRGVAEFQLDTKSLAYKLCEELPDGNPTALTAALDVSMLTDEQMGKGSWAAMNDTEREQMASAYRRIVLEMMGAFKRSDKAASTLRVLQVKQTADKANVLLMHSAFAGEFLEKLTFAKANGGWYLVEAMEADTGLRIVAEMLKPAIWQIVDQRRGKSSRSKNATNLVRVLVKLHDDPKTAVTVADDVLKEEPNDRDVLYAKSLALAQDQKTVTEAIEIWEHLSNDAQPLPAALLKLANHFGESEKQEERNRALELYQRYVNLEPDDPRGHSGLAELYGEAMKADRAEVEYRAAVAADASNAELYKDLAEFLVSQKKYAEAMTAINEGARHASAGDDLLGSLFQRLMLNNSIDHAEAMARAIPQQMTRSAEANLSLGRMRMVAHRALEALPLLRKAAELDKKSSEPFAAIAECYRYLRNWPAALSAANTAIDRDAEDPNAYYQRACALARLGRAREAMASLKRSIDLDSLMAESLEDEQDLKSLSSLAEFKKLLADRDK